MFLASKRPTNILATRGIAQMLMRQKPPFGGYFGNAPNRQNVLDIFEGAWTSKMPNGSGLATKPGGISLFADPRITWLSDRIGGFEGLRILELGPLEAGHTYMMHEGGAKYIVGVESNTHAFLKCLCIKEVFQLLRANFLLGDLTTYLAQTPDAFDLCVASGVLYHMKDPVRTLLDAAKAAPTLYLWTHYYDETVIRDGPYAPLFTKSMAFRVQGHAFVAAKRYYGRARYRSRFLGGASAFTLWLAKESLFEALELAGFRNLEVGQDEPEHPNGPAISILARC